MSDLDRRLIRSSAWVGLSFGGSQVVSFLVMIVLARLLTPEAFGVVALASIALFALAALQESGLGAAIIRRRTDVERAAATQLVFATGLSLAMYGVCFGIAPLLSRAFRQPDLTDVLRVLALTLVLRGLAAAPGTLIEREMNFRARAKGELTGTLVQAVVGITLAALGFGVWSLVSGQLAGQLVSTAIYWVVAPFRPIPRLASWSLFRELARYGRHITVANLLGLVTDNADNVVIGRLLGAVSVGTYNMAWRLANLPATEISHIVGRVTFPAYAMVQDDKPAFRRVFVDSLRRVAFLSLPVSFGILLAAEPIVLGLFGGKWEAAVVPLQILAVFGIVRSLSGMTGAVFQAGGRPQLNYQIGLWHAAVLFGMLYLLAPAYGVNGVATAEIIAAVASMVPAYYFALEILDLSLKELLSSLERPVICSLVVAAGLFAVREAAGGLSLGLQLSLLVSSGVAIYGATILTFGRADFQAITAALRSRSASSA